MTQNTFGKIRRWAAAWTLLLGLLLLSGASAPPPPAPPSVVLLTVDGVRWDYPARFALPAFAEMGRRGTRAERLLPPFPSLTWVCHATLATGTYPHRHGIAANAFLDRETDTRFAKEPEAKWLLEPPLWVLAERAGLKSAVVSWPLSDGDWKGVSPTYRRGFQKGRGGSDEENLRFVLDLLEKPPAQRPRLILCWTSGADDEGHEEGPDGEGVRRAMARCDRLLARLRKAVAARGARNPVVLLVASDHGMSAVERTLDLGALVPKRGFYPYIATSGPVANLYVKDEAQREEVWAALRRLPSDFQVYDRAACPPELHYAGCPRAGDLVVLAPPHATFRAFSRSPVPLPPLKGNHGYPPSNPDVQGILYLEGPGIPAGKVLPQASAVDVAPTVCRILGLPPPPDAEGRSLVP
ncbi:MAG: alkaline phosphatase family protein [Acidobacteriota bacterium]